MKKTWLSDSAMRRAYAAEPLSPCQVYYKYTITTPQLYRELTFSTIYYIILLYSELPTLPTLTTSNIK